MENFLRRHIGPSPEDIHEMVNALGHDSLDGLIEKVVPSHLRQHNPLTLPWKAHSEQEGLRALKKVISKNQVWRSYIGMGYVNAVVPPVIQRNVLENPGWYTQYTPYQPEISQGRLEALLTFQTMVTDLTGLPIANASLLDEGTAAAEAFALAFHTKKNDSAKKFFISATVHPQSIEVVRTRAKALGIEIEVGELSSLRLSEEYFGILLQYPDTFGVIEDYRPYIQEAHAVGALVVMAADILALTLLTPPGELGADIAIGSTQRFGVPIGFGGPHAAYFATKDELKRLIPGRIVGVSKDAQGKPALRLSLQTREQHIRREKATSNICTAQVLLANMAAFYAVYHGPKGLSSIAQRIYGQVSKLAGTVQQHGYTLRGSVFFDTLTLTVPEEKRTALFERARALEINLRVIDDQTVGVTLDESVTEEDLFDIAEVFTGTRTLSEAKASELPTALLRTTPYLLHEVFRTHHSETEMLRYLRRLESRDLSLTTSMIPLGSCTMKLNSVAEMYPVSWSEFGAIHPFAPSEQTEGYREVFSMLEDALCRITGFAKTSLQPNAGSQGEYAGLLVIREYQKARGEDHRRVCLIPKSAHGTNPASAVMAGLEVVPVACDNEGNVDLPDLREKVAQYRDTLSCLMVTYPSTHGVFEEEIKEITALVHEAGGQVYMDGANLNALVGLVSPGELGMDVCHINLHKTFCIPHGGGGPGMGPIGVAQHLAPYLPSHPIVPCGGEEGIGPISAAPWGSASILPISLMYMLMMGGEGLTTASKVAILNANYIAHRLKDHYPVAYKGGNGYVAHECIVDLRSLKEAGVEVGDVAARLMDYGFHAPTVSWPVPFTMMIEPTESESKAELDRFCEALIQIHEECQAIKNGKLPRDNNPLKNAPHTAEVVTADEWTYSYSRTQAAFPTSWSREHKFWPSVGRIDAAYGDRNFICSCAGFDRD